VIRSTEQSNGPFPQVYKTKLRSPGEESRWSRREEIDVDPWLTDTSVDRQSWGYIEDADYKSVNTLVTGFVDRVSKYGSTLMNVGPRPDGLAHAYSLRLVPPGAN